MPPPRLKLTSLLGSSPLCLRQKPSTSCTIPLISIANASSKSKKKGHSDPYAVAQAQARKEANIRRQAELREQRASVLGDPVRGISTPFIESLDKINLPIPIPPKSKHSNKSSASTDLLLLNPPTSTGLILPSPGGLIPAEKHKPTHTPTPAAFTYHLNHFLKPAEVEKSFQHSFILTQPVPGESRAKDPFKEAEDIERHQKEHERATAAIMRIVRLQNGNAKDRLQVNKQRCIETFGRHVTDHRLPPKIPSYVPRGEHASPAPIKTPRAGPDTGSSEVQVAILTTKIKALADKVHKKDKMNQRNLRLLVHKRQKLLKYLRRKEHGGPRWTNLIETLGLTEGTWREEINM